MNTVEKIDQAIDSLEGSFKAFQEKQEHRFQQFYTAANRPKLGEGVSDYVDGQKKQAFLDYITKGSEGGMIQKALTAQEGRTGGYFIPAPMVDLVQQRLSTTSYLRSLARVTTVSTDTLELLLDKGNADVGWVGELDDRAETGVPELTKVRISVHQIYAKPRASQKILDDTSIDVEQWLVNKVSEKMSACENAAFIHGDGDGKPKGFLSYPCVPLRQVEWGKFEALKTGVNGGLSDSDALINTLYAMKPEYLRGAVWFMSRSAMASIRRLKDESTGHYLWQPGLLAGAPDTLLGHPVMIADEMPPLVSGVASSSVVLANFYEAYQIVDRAGIHVLRDPYSAKPYVEFYATKRVGGDVVNFDAIKVIRFEE
ncbi:MAG: phage major capsid protein [Alphaproteobacteria bacterium]|nr:phage major capsid protein [Alphaproteobacteria bacterium]